jgi:hypothetical protein
MSTRWWWSIRPAVWNLRLRLYPAPMSDANLTRLRLQLIVEQSARVDDRPLPDFADALDTLISALSEGGADHSLVERLRTTWSGIEIINAVCLDEGRTPSPTEKDQLREDAESLRQAAAAALEHVG